MGLRDLALTFNPFEGDDDDDERTPHNRPFLGSALLPDVESTVARRRSSFGASDSSFGTIRKRHSRSRTEFNIDIPDPEDDCHPLRSAALKSALFQDFDITRPHLSRITQSSNSMRRSVSLDLEDSAPKQEEEKEVIVHTVTSKDSLAGVSLKYGIPLAELRRANQLWASDSIHLRKDLYIPINQARRAHEYLAELRVASSKAPAQLLKTGTLPPPGSVADPNLPNIRRIPTSQLSFFPPSAHTSRSHTPSEGPSPIAAEFTTQRAQYHKASTQGTRVGPSPAHSLTSLLTALPIGASTRDEIVSRLSLDSVNSSYSDRPPRSRAGSDEGLGHEMEDVHGPSSQRREDEDSSSPFAKTPRSYYSNEIPLTSILKAKHPPSVHPSPYGRSLLSTSPPSSYVPQQPYNPYVRTQQLEPTPVMQLPIKDTHRSVDRKVPKDSAKKLPYRSVSAEPRNRSTKQSGGDAINIDYGIELGPT